MQLKKTYLAAALMIAASLPSQAELISSDYLSEGDSLAALDTETGLEWLSLSETNGMSINDALDAINGGKLDGWRLPTQLSLIHI